MTYAQSNKVDTKDLSSKMGDLYSGDSVKVALATFFMQGRKT